MSLLDDGPFRIITQLGLVNTIMTISLCAKRRRPRVAAPTAESLPKPGEPLSEFVEELRTLADKVYHDWEPKERLEMARNCLFKELRQPPSSLC